jgi:hypothetical protein
VLRRQPEAKIAARFGVEPSRLRRWSTTFIEAAQGQTLARSRPGVASPPG